MFYIKNNIIKSIAFLMAVMLIIGILFPITAFAEDEDILPAETAVEEVTVGGEDPDSDEPPAEDDMALPDESSEQSADIDAGDIPYPTSGSENIKDNKQGSVEEILIGALATYNWTGSTPPTVADGDTVTISGSPSGTLNVPAGATITVNGSVTTATSGVTLNIPAGSTVNWNAPFQGVATTYMITVTGGGTLTVGSCTIGNSGSGGGINVSGAGTTVNVGSGSTVYSDTGGNAVLITSNNVTVNVTPGGSIESFNGNLNAALQIGGSGGPNTITGTQINVNGGSVVSDGSGYAINDSAGTGTVANNTQITVNSGSVTAGGNSAIYSTGTSSVVTVNGGTVSNAASNNLNPAIQMNGSIGDNIFINGGTIQSTTTGGYAVQTTGNVLVSGGLVTAINGRAINLVGLNSRAQVTGGTVQTTGTGNAISTATSSVGTVANASVTVSGGTVTSTGGNAINVTGEFSTVTVTGGTVSTSATSSTASSPHNAINSSGTSSAITVNGGTVSAPSTIGINTTGVNASVSVGGTAQVSSNTGTAIQTTGSGSSVTINGNSQVWVLKQGYAINSSGGGTVTLNGGFVFAYGVSWTVINVTPYVSSGGVSQALVVAWNQANGVTQYPVGSSVSGNNPDLTNSYNGTNTNFWWYNHPTLGGGINYVIGTNTGFFPIAKVTIVNDYGLIYNVADGYMYSNIDGTGTLSAANTRVYPTNWTGTVATSTLELSDFTWNTSAPVALTIVNGPVNIIINGTNNLTSNGSQTNCLQGVSAGIVSNTQITISGSGALNAQGGLTTDVPSAGIVAAGIVLNSGTVTAVGGSSQSGGSYGLSTNSITMTNGTLIARGDSSAISSGAAPFTLPTAYIWWATDEFADPGNLGTGNYFAATAPAPNNVPFTYDSTDKLVKITAAPFAVINDVTVSGTQGAILPSVQATITIYGDTLSSNLAGENISSWFNNLPYGLTATADSNGNIITVTFSGTPRAGSQDMIDMFISGSALSGGMSIPVLPNPDALYDISASFELLLLARPGGEVTGTPSGMYHSGLPIGVTAVPNQGFHFIGWTVVDGSLSIPDNQITDPDVFFDMPESRVVLAANFAENVDAYIDPDTLEFNKYKSSKNNKDLTTRHYPGSYSLEKIMYGSHTLVEGQDYIINVAAVLKIDTVDPLVRAQDQISDVVFKKAYLTTLPLGSNQLVFVMSGGVDPVLTVNVKDAKDSGGGGGGGNGGGGNSGGGGDSDNPGGSSGNQPGSGGTGDFTDILIWLFAMIISAITAAFIFRRSRSYSGI